MNKKGDFWIIFLIIILVILIALGVFWFSYKETYYFNSAIKGLDSSKCDKINNDYKFSDCLGEVASINGNASLCSDSPGLQVMSCFSLFAEKNGDITKCQLVEPDVNEYNCYMAFAEVKRVTSICDVLPGEKKDYCYQAVAIGTNDISICNNLPASNIYKTSCADNVKQQNP